MSEKTLCFYINAIQIIFVEELKSGTIQVIDYYDTCNFIFFVVDLETNFKYFFLAKKASEMITVPKLEKCQPRPSNKPDDYVYNDLGPQ